MATRQVTIKIDQGGKIRATKKFKHFLKKKEKQKKSDEISHYTGFNGCDPWNTVFLMNRSWLR